MAQGRTFDRTQSYPVISHSDPFDPIPQAPLSGFMTSQQTYQHAERTLLADEARRRELRPYADTTLSPPPGDTPIPSTADASSSRRRSPSPRATLRLDFSPDAMDAQGAMVEVGQGGKHAARRTRSREFIKAKKRKDDGSDTETDGDEADPTGLDDDVAIDMESDHTFTAGDVPTAPDQDFPPVFQSPQISQPELFAPPPSRALPSRLVRNMPGRQLGKTVSAPVGGLGRFGRLPPQPLGDEEMDVEDGFDVSEWAASEEF